MAVTGALGTRVYISSTLPTTTTPHYSEDAYRKDVLATPFPSGYLTAEAGAIDDTEINIDGASTKAIAAGQKFTFGSETVVRTVSAAVAAQDADTDEQTLTFTPALTATLADNSTLSSAAEEDDPLDSAMLEIGEIMNAGEFGKEFQIVRNMNLADGATRKAKGSYDNGSFEVEVLFEEEDAGQILAKTASDSTAHYAFAVRWPQGQVFYFSGLVSRFRYVGEGPDNMLRAMLTVEINHHPIVAATWTSD